MAKKRSGTKRRPEKQIQLSSGVGVAVWRNQIDTDRGEKTVRSITIKPRRYYDQTADEWRDASGYNPSDLPALIFVLQKAQEYCFETPLDADGSEVDGDTPF